MKALTAAEMREVDRLTTERFGIPSLQLMESAGKRVANAVRASLATFRQKRVVVLCGKGNNGGDGFVAARLLNEAPVRPQVFLFGKRDEVRGDAGTSLDVWLRSGGEITEVIDSASLEDAWPKIATSQAIVDALLGTGLRGPATGLIAEVITRLNRLSQNATLARPALILAVDIPSGLPSDGQPADGPCLYAHRTITFTAPKIGQLVSQSAACCGQLEVRQIGSHAGLIEEIGLGAVRCANPGEFAGLPLVRGAESHKGTFGHVVIMAGSRGKSGAAVLAGYACLRAGAGLTTIATPDEMQPIVAEAYSEYMTEPLLSTKTGGIAAANSSSGRIAKILEDKSAAAVGPGIGTHVETRMVVQQVVREATVPIILDADGLNCFDGEADKLGRRKTQYLAITPHPGEMARLLGKNNTEVQSERMKIAVEAAKKWNAHVILKGYHTIVAAPDGRLYVNTTGGPSLAKGGTGDVLTGVLAGLTSQFGTKDWLRVLALGVYLHGIAGDILARNEEPSGVIAHEVAEMIPEARAWLLREIQSSG